VDSKLTNFSQIPLNFWKDEYQNEWIVGNSNEIATKILIDFQGQILLSGPNFCGKKHIATKIAKLEKCNVFIADCMSDREIVAMYDQITVKNFKAIWVFRDRNFSADVLSRFNMMQKAEIYELTEDMIFPILSQRFANLGFDVRNDFVNFCIFHIPRTYEAVELCVRYLRQINEVSQRKFREFFRQEFR